MTYSTIINAPLLQNGYKVIEILQVPLQELVNEIVVGGKVGQRLKDKERVGGNSASVTRFMQDLIKSGYHVFTITLSRRG